MFPHIETSPRLPPVLPASVAFSATVAMPTPRSASFSRRPFVCRHVPARCARHFMVPLRLNARATMLMISPSHPRSPPPFTADTSVRSRWRNDDVIFRRYDDERKA